MFCTQRGCRVSRPSSSAIEEIFSAVESVAQPQLSSTVDRVSPASSFGGRFQLRIASLTVMSLKIGYLVPEFPGQTHAFFWREIAILEQLGVEVDIISTRLPPNQIMSHDWTKTARERTTYLFPPTSKLGAIAATSWRSGWQGWRRVWGAIARVRGATRKQRLRLLGLAAIGAELAACGRERGWQHVHVHSCADSANIALFARLLGGITYSLTLHGRLSDYGANQEQKWRYAAFGLVITRQLETDVRQLLAGNLPPAIAIAPMGVNVETFARTTPYRPWQGNGVCRLFSCGRLNPCKGHVDAIAAAARLRDEGWNVELAIAGEDEQGGSGYRRQLESEIAAQQLGDSVHLLGAVSEARIRAELERAQMFVLASWHEPLGIAIAEAMACEVPVVVTGSGGVRELVTDGVEGILVEPRSPESLAAAIAKLAADPETARRMGRAGRERIRQHFHSRRSAEVLVQAIAATIDASVTPLN